LASYPIEDKRLVTANLPFRIGELTLEAYPVEHSVRAPAVGYRVSASGTSFFYVPGLVAIRERSHALHGVDLYIGDGATISRPMARRRAMALLGHTPVSAQHAIFTHCGSEIVAGNARYVAALVKRLGAQRRVGAA
jgi:hypothetical protein